MKSQNKRQWESEKKPASKQDRKKERSLLMVVAVDDDASSLRMFSLFMLASAALEFYDFMFYAQKPLKFRVFRE